MMAVIGPKKGTISPVLGPIERSSDRCAVILAAGANRMNHPLFLNPAAIPLIDMWMPRWMRSSPSPLR